MTLGPYSHLSLSQLEEIFERADSECDNEALELLAEELEQRPKEPVKSLLAKINAIRFDQDLPPPSPPRENSVHLKGRKINKTNSQHRPTDEQELAIQMFKNGGSLKINAYAGAGKTSTLILLANSSLRNGQYIAFNKDITLDAKRKFPKSVDCATSHSLAYKSLPRELSGNPDKMRGSINAHQLARHLEIKAKTFDRHLVLQARSLAFLFLETIRCFTQSNNSDINDTHVPKHGVLANASSEAVIKAVNEYCVKHAKDLWNRMQSPNDPLPLGHDGYLKMWALSEPRIAADFIFLDEAQDSNAVILDVLKKQAAQIVYVGDKYQQIYEWRGAVNAMERIQTDSTISLTMSFRFGHEIAHCASKVLRQLGESDRIRGNPEVPSRIERASYPDAILARTNAGAISATIEKISCGWRPHLVGGHGELVDMLHGVEDLKRRDQSNVPEFFGFNTWSEVVEFAKSGEGQHLLTFVNLIESRGERDLLRALENTVDASEAQITISTAHRAKGREWDSVRLCDDFRLVTPVDRNQREVAGKSENVAPAELRLLYVAITRARKALDISHLEFNLG